MAAKRNVIQPVTATPNGLSLKRESDTEYKHSTMAKAKQLTPQQKLERKREQSRNSWRRKREREDETLRHLSNKKACFLNSNKLLVQENKSLRQIISQIRGNQQQIINQQTLEYPSQLCNSSLFTHQQQRWEGQRTGDQIFPCAPWQQDNIGQASLAQIRSNILNQSVANCLLQPFPFLPINVMNTGTIAMSAPSNPDWQFKSAINPFLRASLLLTPNEAIAKSRILLGEVQHGDAQVIRPSLLRTLPNSATMIHDQFLNLSTPMPFASVPLVGLNSTFAEAISSADNEELKTSKIQKRDEKTLSVENSSTIASSSSCNF